MLYWSLENSVSQVFWLHFLYYISEMFILIESKKSQNERFNKWIIVIAILCDKSLFSGVLINLMKNI